MTVLEFAARSEYAWKCNVREMSGYEAFTTFYSDFTIAELVSGLNGIKDTYKRAFKAWKGNYKYLTELTMVLNHKIWEHHSKTNMAFAKLYDELWKELDAWCMENLKDEQLSYFLEVLD